MSDSDDDSRVPQANGERKVIVAVRVRPKKNYGTERYDSACLHIDHGFDFGASCLLSPTRGSDASERPNSFSGASVKSTAQQPTVMISDPEGKVDPLTFAFDRVFDDTDDQETVYQEIVHGPVLSALDSGGDALFVAYGQTGSGKTYTMLGEQARYVSSNTPITPPLSLASSHRGLRLDQTLGSPGKVMAGTTYLGGEDHSPTDVGAGAGVLMRVMSTVLQYKEAREGLDKQWHVVVAMSAVEVYNDSLFDLLAANGGARAHIKTGPNARNVELDVREFGDDLFITNLQRFVITNTSHVQMVFEIALKNRSVAPTHMNDTSSRSHAIFTTEVFLQRRTASNPDPPDPGLMAEHLISSSYINSRTKRNNAAANATSTSALSPEGNPSNDFISFPFAASRITMVDLAGNERVKKSGVSGKELNEAVAVNKSLSALGHVVHQICQGSRHISFRDSKVTRLLRSSFSNPKSKIVFITNVSPIGLSYPESVCSLRFAARLKELKPVVSAAASQPNVAVREDQILQRLHIFEQLCADFRILRDGHDYRPQVSRWRKSTGNTRLSAKGAAIRYGDEVKELQETRRVLELEHYVQEFASSIRLSSSQANTSTGGGTTAEAKGNERQIELRAELEQLDKAIVEERAAVKRSKSDLAKLQEEMNAANRLLGVKSDAQRAIAALMKEADELDALIIAAKDPTKSEYGQALDGLNSEKAAMVRDAEINAANAQFATRLLEHNNSKIAVRAERIEQLGLRNTIDSIQQRIMSLYSNRTMQRVRVPVSALAASDTMDMRKVLEMCSVRQQQVSVPLRDDQLIDGPQALEQVMARRLKETTSLSFGNVSPIAFYVSPQTSVQLGKYLKGLGESAAHVRSGSSHSVSNFDSDDEQTTVNTQKVQCVSEPPLVLFETIAEKKRHILKEALSLIVTHGRVLEILDEVHASRFVGSATLHKLFVALDDVPIDGNAFGAIVSCAKRQGDDGGSSSDWSGDELESNLDSPTSVVRQESKPTNQRLVATEHTRRVLKRILEGSAKLSPSNIALIRCVQAYALFNRVDDLCEAAQDPQKLTINRVIAEIRRRAMLRRILDVQSSPLSSVAGSTEEKRVRSSDILPTDSLDSFVKSCYASMGGSSNEEIDSYLSYLSPHAGAMSSQVLCSAALLGHRAPLVAALRRDVSPIAFYGSRIIDSANLMASPTAAEVSEAIPYMPSSVRFTEMMLMCCGYRR